MLLPDLAKDDVIRRATEAIANARPGADSPVKLCGTWGSFAPMLAAHISKTLKRPMLYISPHIDDADNVCDDMTVFLGQTVQTFPVWEDTQRFEDATDEIGAQRLRLALSLTARDYDPQNLVIATSIQAINQPVPAPSLLRQNGLKLHTSQTIEPELVVNWLVDNGFERTDSIDLPGQFAARGGIIDIFSSVTAQPGSAAAPVRIEFFGDTIETLRTVDLDTKRSKDNIDSICVIPPSACIDTSSTEMFVKLLPEDTIIFIEEPVDVAEVSNVFLERIEDPTGLYPFSAIYKALQNFACVEVSRFAPSAGQDILELNVTSAVQFEHKAGRIWKDTHAVLKDIIDQTRDKKVLLFCENNAEISRLTEIINDLHGKIPPRLKLLRGFIRQGFIINSLRTIVISHHEIFGQYAIRRRIRTIKTASPVEKTMDLKKGDFVVHISYGIGKFRGVRTIEKDGAVEEYLTLEYADKMIINVPVKNIALVQKYIGAVPKRPRLSKIGTKKWENQKKRVAQGVQELAAELLEIQARRRKAGGFAFDQDTTWQLQFEESFLYEETPDQLTAIEQIKKDMTQPVPMDRLLCGDVGYGKTELAMRAAFKAVESGKQVALLVPTTVLCVQHGSTFRERFADFPVTVEILNRFVTPARAKEIVTQAKAGKVDILIGTHRLLSEDMGFRDLGLLIIDEEQRFGVEHKERLKRFRVNVDILTLTATPIPRTLHMSLLGLRDISSLSTPPLDRRSIVTKICRYDEGLIRKVIFNELNRDGQVFFLHNRVRSIEKKAFELREIINDDRVTIDIGHGQMHKHQLEEAMLRFVNGQTDVLVCSTIIESGLDIPNANTIIINNADKFGLAQLHQLRGRVGRYKHRAYAYMLMPRAGSVNPTAAKRLKAIEEYSQLGSGFRIALRDLEIRGAGNILGPEQSGHINTVGYELYCRLLSDAVKKLKNEPVETAPQTVIDLGISTYIPKSYIPSDSQRMDVYRRISLASHPQDLTDTAEELRDLFGPVPDPVLTLIDITQIRIAAARWKIKSIVARQPDLIFYLDSQGDTADLFARAPGSVRIPNPTTVHIRLGPNYFEPKTMMSILRKLLRVKS